MDLKEQIKECNEIFIKDEMPDVFKMPYRDKVVNNVYKGISCDKLVNLTYLISEHIMDKKFTKKLRDLQIYMFNICTDYQMEKNENEGFIEFINRKFGVDENETKDR